MKKILSVLLCICMVLTLIPATVMASGTDKVYINGTNFPMGDGSTTTYYKNGINGGSAGSENDWNAKLYNDNGTLTLVLKGFEYYGDQVGIYATEDLKIVLEGIENSITTTSYGIWVQGDLEITGNDTCRIDIDAEGDYAIEANTQNPSDYATITINSVTEVQASGRSGAISAEEAVVIIDSYIEPVGSDFGIKGGGYYQGQAKNITIKGKSDVYASGHTPFYSAPIVDGAFEWTDYYAGGWQDYTENTQYDEDWIDANYIQLRYNRNGGSNDGNEELEYYLIGTINNGDCYDEEYKFVGGKIDIEFTSPAFVGVMDSQRNFYYAENFPGMSPTEVVLGLGNSASNRMYIPTAGNYTFWLTVNDDGTVTLSLNQPVVTAYTVSFDANGGTGTMEAVNDVTGEYTLPACTFTAPDGKQFKAWSVDGTEKAVSDTITVTADTTVTAVWEDIENDDDNEALEYYLVGMINNSDHYEKEYKFIDGKIEFKFTSDSYVAVMDSEENIYQTDGWIDFDPTEATLKLSGDNKMHIGSKSDNRTLWLTVNDDGTLTLRTFDPSTIEEFEATATLMYGAYYNDIPYVGIMVEATGIPATATEYGVKIDGYKYPATSKLVNGKFVVDVANSPRALIADTGYNAKVYYTENGEDVYAEDGLNFFTPASMLDINGYYYADGDNIGYKYNSKGIDVMGKDGTDSWIQSTYAKAGWPMAYGNTSTVNHSSPAAKSVYSGDINAWVVPEISEDGYFVKVKYFIRNVTDTEITDFRFGASADVQIGSQDSAPIRKTEYGLELSDGTNTFALLLNEGYVEIPVTTQWFGYFNVAAENVYNVIDSDSYNSGDSGAAYSWQNITLDPGEIKCYEVMLGVGDSDTLGSILTPSADIEYEDEALLDLEAGELYKITCDGVTYEITAESGGSIALAGKDNNDTDYNFIGKTISVVEVVNGEESAPQEVTIANRPVAVVPAKIVGDGEIELPDELDVVTTDTTITIKADENQVYSIDNGTTWVTPTEGSVTFAGLTDGTTYTILTKVNATSTSFASLNAEFEVKAAKMFDASDVEITGTSIVYDGEAHGITAQAEGAEAMYSSALNGSYTSECPTYTNVGTYSIYYKISKEGYHDYYGVGTLEILPKKINTTIELTAPVANAAPMLNVENEEYTAVVIWSPAVMDKFDYSTAYTANITVTPKANYTLTGVTENEFVITGATVTNAADSGDVTAVFEATGAKRTGGGGGVSRYTVKFDTNGGTAVANKTVTRNAKLAEPTAPTKDGYTFDGWYTDKELTTAYDFDTKVTKSFTLYAKWVEAKATHVCPSEKFSDLDTTKWYHEDIDYVLDNEIMLGTSETVFAPEGSLTRGMLVTILYRSEGEPATNKSIPFADVDMSAYYANAVVWAQQNGIVKGISETEYAPDMNVTREQLATIMFRYAQFKGMDAVTAEENLGFNDASDISEWAVTAMNWGVGRDYIFSRTEGSIAPKVAATRAEIAAFIHRYIVDNVK